VRYCIAIDEANVIYGGEIMEEMEYNVDGIEKKP